MKLITDYLKQYTDEERAKVMGKNALKIYQLI